MKSFCLKVNVIEEFSGDGVEVIMNVRCIFFAFTFFKKKIFICFWDVFLDENIYICFNKMLPNKENQSNIFFSMKDSNGMLEIN